MRGLQISKLQEEYEIENAEDIYLQYERVLSGKITYSGIKDQHDGINRAILDELVRKKLEYVTGKITSLSSEIDTLVEENTRLQSNLDNNTAPAPEKVQEVIDKNNKSLTGLNNNLQKYNSLFDYLQ
jgi:hypothetical protein